MSVTIGFSAGSLNNANMGCNALTYSAIKLILQALPSHIKSCKFIIFTHENAKCLELYPTLADVDVCLQEIYIGLKGIIKGVLRNDLPKRTSFYKAIKECDILFEIGGGDSFSDIYGLKRLYNYYRLHSLAWKANVPTAFLPQTIGPFASPKAQHLAEKLLRNSVKIFVRDPISYNVANDYVGKDKLSKTIDMAFFMESEGRSSNFNKKKTVGINPSGLLWNGGYTADNQFGLKDDYRDVLRTLIMSIDNELYDIAVFAHVLDGPGYSIEDDYKVCKQLVAEFPQCKIAPFFYTPVEAKSYVSELDFVVAARMHACIAAYSTGVPVFPLAYSRKFKGLFYEELGYKWGVELTSEDCNSAVEKFRSALGQIKYIHEFLNSQKGNFNKYKEEFIAELQETIFDIII